MKKTEVELPDAIYRQVEQMAGMLHLTVAELLCKAAEQMVHRQAIPAPRPGGDWRFPEGRRLGAFCTPVEEWRLLANEIPD